MKHGADLRDEDLLRRLATGDEEAFRAFYARHQGALYRFALHMTGRAESAEEVVQESFMTLLRQARKFDPARGQAAAFLFGIARNHVHRLLENDSRYTALPEEGPEGLSGQAVSPFGFRENDLTGELERAEIAAQVRRAVLSLPEHYREAITLCDLEEMDYERAARILSCPVGTVRSRLNRAREMLFEKMRLAVANPGPVARATGTE